MNNLLRNTLSLSSGNAAYTSEHHVTPSMCVHNKHCQHTHQDLLLGAVLRLEIVEATVAVVEEPTCDSMLVPTERMVKRPVAHIGL